MSIKTLYLSACVSLASAVLSFLPVSADAAQSLLYYEAQAVASRASDDAAIHLYSSMPGHSMQKPAIGFDYTMRLSSAGGDWGVLAVQPRVAYGGGDIEFQLYNAFLKLKFSSFDIWAGHGKPSFGLSYSLDSHGELLQPLSMEGFGFDRDWGLGAYKSAGWGDIGICVTSGTGMPLFLDGNYFASARASYKILERDNISYGLSLGGGSIPEIEGYMQTGPGLHGILLSGADLSAVYNNYTFRLDSALGVYDADMAYALMLRVGASFLEDNNLRFDIQPQAVNKGAHSSVFGLYAGLSYSLTSYLSFRITDYIEPAAGYNRLAVQAYLYNRM